MPRKKRVVTPEMMKTICDAIEAGNTRECAAQAIGVSPRWFYMQIAKGADFAAAIARADALAEQHHVQVIQTAARRGQWPAAAWWLERRRAQDWGRVDRVEVTIRRQAEKIAAELGLSTDEVLAEAERIVKAGV